MTVIAGLLGPGLSPQALCDVQRFFSLLRPWRAREPALARARHGIVGGSGERSWAGELRTGQILVAAGHLNDTTAIRARVGQPLPGPGLLASCWERWGLETLRLVSGDFSLAVVEPGGELFLARSFQSSEPLFWRPWDNGAAFASMPQALRRNDDGPPDLTRAALIAAQIVYWDQHTLFPAINSVRHGTAIRIGADGVGRQVWEWSPASLRQRLTVVQAGEALRDLLDSAVAERTAGDGIVATQLSGGRDSAAVTASLATQLADKGASIAVTAAPMVGFSGPHRPGHMSDEAPLAAEVAMLYPNIRHVVVRPTPLASLADIAALSALHHRPLTNVVSLPWSRAILDAGRDAGATRMLVGSRGNFTISLGAHFFLADLARERGWNAAARYAASIAGSEWRRWRSLLHAAVGPYLSPDAYRFLLRMAGHRPAGRRIAVALLADPWRRQAEECATCEFADQRPASDNYAQTLQFLRRIDVGELQTEAHWKIKLSDPTADQRLVELMLALPPDLLLPTREAERPVYVAAFGDRLPPAVLEGRQRGYQGADWFLHFDRKLVEQRWRELLQVPVVDALFDRANVLRRIERWPAGGWQNPDILRRYRGELLGSLGVAEWLACHWPS